MENVIKINNHLFKTSIIKRCVYEDKSQTLVVYLEDNEPIVIKDVSKSDFEKFNNELSNNIKEKVDDWTPENMYSGESSIEDTMTSIEVLCSLHRKYPNDEYISGTIEILRDEMCKLFGGRIND